MTAKEVMEEFVGLHFGVDSLLADLAEALAAKDCEAARKAYKDISDLVLAYDKVFERYNKENT